MLRLASSVGATSAVEPMLRSSFDEVVTNFRVSVAGILREVWPQTISRRFEEIARSSLVVDSLEAYQPSEPGTMTGDEPIMEDNEDSPAFGMAMTDKNSALPTKEGQTPVGAEGATAAGGHRTIPTTATGATPTNKGAITTMDVGKVTTGATVVTTEPTPGEILEPTIKSRMAKGAKRKTAVEKTPVPDVAPLTTRSRSKKRAASSPPPLPKRKRVKLDHSITKALDFDSSVHEMADQPV